MAVISEEVKYTVTLTEQTLKELNRAIEEARKQSDFEIDGIEVKSSFSNVAFLISLGQCESLGYELEHIHPVKKKGTPIKPC